ncbi:MAG TPA: hypothetical protein VK681_19890 [Reyranella sp.]|jgi:hypothetical protein|nr:hypothetical protein [Reyranella sp.]
MAKPVSISLNKFTASVQAAVKSAVAKHPKFNVPTPHGVSVSYLIRGIPVPDEILAKVTLAETQAFATEIAGQIAQAHPEALGPARPAPAGAILSVGRYVLLGIPAPSEIIQFEA